MTEIYERQRAGQMHIGLEAIQVLFGKEVLVDEQGVELLLLLGKLVEDLGLRHISYQNEILTAATTKSRGKDKEMGE